MDDIRKYLLRILYEQFANNMRNRYANKGFLGNSYTIHEELFINYYKLFMMRMHLYKNNKCIPIVFIIDTRGY